MSEENEVGAFLDLLNAARWWVLAAGLVSALVAGVLGWPGPALYEALVPVRVQFPSNLARVPQPDRFAQMAKDPVTVTDAARDARVLRQLPLIEKTLVAAVSPQDARTVVIAVQLREAADAKRYVDTLVRIVRAQAMETVKEQIAGLHKSQDLNKKLGAQIARVIDGGAGVRRDLRRSKGVGIGDRLMAEVGLLQMNISALQSRAGLQNQNSQLDADLESLNNAVLLDEDTVVRQVSPISRAGGYALRGLIVGLVVSILALYLPPIRRRLTPE